MPNKRFVLTLVLALLYGLLPAQTISIKGNAPAFKNGVLYLYTISDYVNGTEQLLDSSTVAANGSFEFKPTVSKARYAFVKTGPLLYDLYLEPKQNLEISIADTLGFAVDSTLKPIEVLSPKEGLNTAITRFDAEYNDFLIANYKAFLRKTAQKTTSAFITSLKDKYKGNTNPYFVNYSTYRYGALELLANVNGSNRIIQSYMNNKPVLYANNAYMDLFTSLFDKRLKEFSLTKEGEEIVKTINVNIDYAKCLEILRRDSVLTNDTLRELILIKGIGEQFYNPGMVQYSMLEMLRIAAEKGITPENRLIAEHLIAKLEKLRPGTAAPAFSLKNIVSGETTTLASFKGKAVYLVFWDEDNTRSVEEIDLLRELEKKYGRKVAFVCVSNSADEAKTLAFINRNKYKWTFLNNKGNQKLLNDYEVLSYPSFYLIDADGKIIKCPADRPSGNIERSLDALNKK